MDSPDDALVRRFAAGDRSAFTALVERHQTRVYNLALRMLGSPEDARDVTQDAFLTAFRKLSTFRGEARFGTWMHRVAINACYDSLRKRRRAPVLGALDDHVPEPPPEPDHASATAEALDVRRALAGVPDEFRAVLVLRDVQDLPYEEIAGILEVPMGTVKSRVHRGRVAVARALAGNGEPTEDPRASDQTRRT